MQLNRVNIVQIMEKRELTEEEIGLVKEYEATIEKFRDCYQQLEESGGTIKETLETIEDLMKLNKRIAQLKGKLQELKSGS